ncbi:GNAT family N-acetyltransferase [Kitasatospora camelliae]|uniref:GNAT family N-acetyltransferase n=1 Tax=Kitasatospora camelliae TaxID=3156397 RepID=A0AAU8JWQ4_9ACTN
MTDTRTTTTTPGEPDGTPRGRWPGEPWTADAWSLDARHVERLAADAWPAGHSVRTGGWLLRHTAGVDRRRSNSALPEGHGPDRTGPGPDRTGLDRTDPAGAAGAYDLAPVEAFYAERGLPVTVQVSPAEQHTALDAHLAARGYRLAAPTLVCVAATADTLATPAATAPGVSVRSEEHPGPAWTAAFTALDGRPDSAAVAERVIARIPGPAAFLSAAVDGEPAGIALFAAAEGWAGVFCLATHPRHRRRGVAGAVLREGARWARERSAEYLYLQVEEANTAARALYTRAGFRPSHRYHYRVLDPTR